MMTDANKIMSKRTIYLILLGLYIFWFQCIIWVCRINTYSSQGESYLVLNLIFFYISHAFGCAFFSWLYGKEKLPLQIPGRVLNAGLTILISLLTILASLASGAASTILFSVIGLMAGFILAIILNGFISQIQLKRRGASMGKSYGFALLVNFMLFIVLVPKAGSGLYSKSYVLSQGLFTAAVFSVIGLCVICFGKNESHNIDNKRTAFFNDFAAIRQSRFIILFFIICFFFYLNIGIQDCVASFSWFKSGNSMFLTKVFSIAGAFITGMLCDRMGRHFLVAVSQGLLIVGLVAMMFGYHGSLAFLSFSLVQLAYMAFDISIKLIAIDLAVYSKYPLLMASLGFAFPYFVRQLGSAAGAALSQYGSVPVFVTLILLIAISSPFYSMLFEKIRRIYMENLKNSDYISIRDVKSSNFDENAVLDSEEILQNSLIQTEVGYCGSIVEELSAKWCLTPRESQVLQLVLLGQAVSEMAQNLYISEITVKTHIGRILKKAGFKNRTQLVSSVLKIQTPV